MAITAAQLIAQVSVQGADQAKTALQGVGQEAQQAGEKAKEGGLGLSGMFKNALSFAAGQAIFAGIGFLKDQLAGVFSESMNAADELAQTNAVLASTHDIAGVTAQSVLDLAANFSHLTKFSDDTVQVGENILLTFTNIGKNIFPQTTQAMLDFAQSMHIDVNQAALQLGKALQDPVAGVTALQREGVRLSDSQKALIANLMATGNTAGAQKIILQELRREFGGSAEAAGKTFGGQLKILGQRMDDVKQSIGDALIPILQGLIQHVMPLVQAFANWAGSGHAVSDMLAFFNRNAGIIVPILAGLGAVLVTLLVPAVWSLAAGVIAATWPLLAIGAAVAGVVAIFMHFYQTNAGFKSFIDNLVSGFKQVAGFVVANFIPAMQQIWQIIQTKVWPILQQVGSFLVSTFAPLWQQLVAVWTGQILPALKQLWSALVPLWPILQQIGLAVGGMLVVAFGILVGVIAGVAKGLAGFFSGVATIIGGIVQVITGVVQVISGIVTFIVDLLTGHFSKLGGDLKRIWDGIVNMFSGVWNIIKGIFMAAWGAISGFVSGLVQGVIGFFQHLASVLVGHSIIPDMIGAIVNWFLSLPGKAMSAIGGLLGQLAGFFGGLARSAITWGWNIISNLASGIINGIWSALGNAMNAIGNFIHDHLPHSPAKLGPLRDLAVQGAKIPEQIAQGIVTGIPRLQSSLNLMLSPMAAVPSLVTSGGGGTSATPQIHVSVYLDGAPVAKKLMPHIAQAIRTSTGVKF